MVGSAIVFWVLWVVGGYAQQMPAPNPPYGVPAGQSQPPRLVPQAQQLYSHGDPTPEEQLLLEYINRARANPPAEGERLATTTDPDVVASYQYFGIDVNRVRTQFQSYPARPPLAFHPLLIQAARAHSRDMQQNDFQDHIGSDGSTPAQRLQRVGYGSSAIGENVFAYARSMWHAHCGFNVDWGGDNQQTLGHRRNIMNFDGPIVYTEIGIGVIQDNNPATRVGPYIVTQNFGRGSDVYIVGVVYRDRNGNGFYDIGEGLAGVTITPSRGNYYAVTSTSGGYAIPVTGLTGTITLTAQGGGITASKTVTLTGTNVKVDFTQDVAPVPLPISPDDRAFLRDTTSVRLIWRSIPQGVRYHLQLATDSAFRALVVNDSTLTDTSRLVRSLRNRQTYFWRVRGRHATLGWSDYSPVMRFDVALPLQVPTLYEPGDTVVLDGGPLRFRWSSVGEEVDSYWIEVVSDTNDYELVFDTTAAQDTVFVLSRPERYFEPGQRYFWHVVVYGLTEFVTTPWRQFFTVTTSSVSPLSRKQETECWYQPDRDLLVIAAPPETVGAELVLVDLRGIPYKRATLSAGITAVPADAIPSGVYCVVIRTHRGLERHLITVVH
ncbi:MAG: CAP domain-containing protein [Chlorobi bacterium]|nr:CAP domain-containing protein [Chlorobiota bacterium]